MRLPSRVASSFISASPADTSPQSHDEWRRRNSKGCCPASSTAARAPLVETIRPRENGFACRVATMTPPQPAAYAVALTALRFSPLTSFSIAVIPVTDCSGLTSA